MYRSKFLKKLAVFMLAAAVAVSGSGFGAYADELSPGVNGQAVSPNTVSDGSISPNGTDSGNSAAASENKTEKDEEAGKKEENKEKSEVSENNTASENRTVSENLPEETGVSENEAEVSQNCISENVISVNSVNTAVFEGIEPDTDALIVSANEALAGIIENKVIPAVIVLCDEYGIRKEADENSAVVVTVPISTTVYPREAAYKDGSFWFKVDTWVNERQYTGYVIKDKLIYVDPDLIKWEKEYLDPDMFRPSRDIPGVNMASYGEANAADHINAVASSSIQSFPASYQNALSSLSSKHPNWVFVPQNVGTSFAAALSGELSDKNKNLIYSSAQDSYKNGLYSGKWYYASKACLQYYMDPRNFLTESYIFQFETLNYNPSYQTAAGAQKFLKNTFMKGTIPNEGMTYAEAFEKTGAAHQVSPYHLAARVYQEQGVNGTSALISGTYKGYEGYYNYFNIQANGSDVVLNGLKYAKSQGWNTRYKSLDGGAKFLGDSYINRGQDTLYTQKYNVASSSSRYGHQYMQNAQAPSTESVAMYKIYNGSGSLNDAFIFKIPVYTDMNVPTDSSSTPPTFVNKSVRLNAWSNNGGLVSIIPAYGTEITSVSIRRKDGGESLYFYISGSGEEWYLNLKDRATVQKNNKSISESLILYATASDGKTYNCNFSASAECSKPKVSLQSVRTVNIFGTGSNDMGIYRLSTSEKITTVSDPNAEDRTRSGQPFIIEDHFGGNLVYLKAVNVNNSNINKVTKKVTLKVTLDGYDPVEYTFNAGTRNVKPVIKMKNAVIYRGLSYGTALITDSSGHVQTLPADTKLTTTANDVTVRLGDDRASVIVTPIYLQSYRTGNKKLIFSSSEWNADISVNVSLRKSDKPTLALSDKNVIFNTTLSNATKTIDYYVEGSSLSVNSLKIEGANNKSREALSAGIIRVSDNNKGQLTLSFKTPTSAASYQLKLTGTLSDFGGAPFEMRSVNINVKIVTQTPEKIVGISQRGNVNLVNRAGTDRLYTLSRLDQIGAKRIASVSINGAMVNYFVADALSNGQTDDNGYTVNNTAGGITVHARNNVSLSHKINYEIPLKITLDNGYELIKTVKLKPANSTAGIKPYINNISMVRKGADKICYIKSTGVGDGNTLISSAELVPTDKNSTLFNCTPVTNGSSKLYGVKLSLKDSSMKTGNYTLRFNVYAEGHSTEANPVRVSVKITVK